MDLDEIIELMDNLKEECESIKDIEYYNALSNREIWIDSDICRKNFTLT